MFVAYLLRIVDEFIFFPTAVLSYVNSPDGGSGYVLSFEWLVWSLNFDFVREYEG